MASCVCECLKGREDDVDTFLGKKEIHGEIKTTRAEKWTAKMNLRCRGGSFYNPEIRLASKLPSPLKP